MTKKQISAISKAVVKHMMEAKKDKEETDDVDAIIMSLKSLEAPTPAEKKEMKTADHVNVNTSALKSILRRAKNSTSS